MKYLHQWKARIGFLLASLAFAGFITAPNVLAAAAGSVDAWSTAVNGLPAVKDEPSTATYNGYVYVLGGGFSNDVYYAPLNTDGSVGSWTASAHTLPQDMTGPTATVYNGYVYVMAGQDDSVNPLDVVYYAKLNTDGSVGAWTTATNNLPTAVSGANSVVSNGYLYIVGGIDGSSATLDTISYAKLNTDGSVGTWTTSPNTMPSAVDYPSATEYNSYVYVFGGSYGNTVYYAKLNTDGSVGSWTTASNTLPHASELSSAVAANGYAYIFGGEDATNVLDSVFYAPLNTDGSVGTWTTSPTSMPAGKWDTAGVVYNNYIYDIAGSDSSRSSTDTIYYAHINPLIAVPSDSSGTTNLPTSPDTGYGRPASSNPIVTALIAGAIISTGAGLVVLYRQKSIIH